MGRLLDIIKIRSHPCLTPSFSICVLEHGKSWLIDSKLEFNDRRAALFLFLAPSLVHSISLGGRRQIYNSRRKI